jgi:hypothetical protein
MKNFMIKPQNINLNGQRSKAGSSVVSNSNKGGPALSEKELEHKKEQILTSYSKKLIEIEDLKKHYETRVSN